jgi:RNA polymerase I-specific transcription initiation factor RRN3
MSKIDDTTQERFTPYCASIRRNPEKSVGEQLVLPKCKMPTRAEIEPVELFVASAVQQQYESGDGTNPTENYSALIDPFLVRKDLAMIHRILLALRTSGHGATLNRLASSARHARLIHHIIRLNPFRLPCPAESQSSMDDYVDYDIADAQLHLMMALVSANSVFMIPILTSLWSMLSFESVDAPFEQTQRLHAAMATIVRLCPKAKSELFPIMAASVPFRSKPVDQLKWFYRHCLEVVRYVPAMEAQVLEFLIEKSLEMDVEIKIDEGGEAEIDTDYSFFQLDMDSDAHSLRRRQLNEVNVKESIVNDMAEKLDSLMFLLLEYVEQSCAGNADLIREKYRILAQFFESSIIITHKSKFVQFLIVHVCGLENKALESASCKNDQSPAILYRKFASSLIHVIVDPYRATDTRQAAACYLASFVSRASFVCEETCCESVCALLRWGEAYMQSLDSLSVHAADAREQCNFHSLFYTISQAAFYIMCFRGVEAIEFYRKSTKPSSDGFAQPEHLDISPERWTSLCSHPLQPLRYCLESVRNEFLELSKFCHLINAIVYCQLAQDENNVVKRNKRQVTPIATPATLEKERLSGGVGGLGKGTNPLDSFFPFDPYLLRKSHVFVDPFYNHWNGSITERFMKDEDSVLNPSDEQHVDDDESDNKKGSIADGVSHDDFDNEIVTKSFQPMSLGSEFGPASASSRSTVSTESSSNVPFKRDSSREPWTDTMKRSRAPSMENGSW